MICAEHLSGRTCQQGKVTCRRPLTCSGASEETESAIRLHRAMNAPLERDLPIQYAEPEPMSGSVILRYVLIAVAGVATVAFLAGFAGRLLGLV